MPHMNVDQIAKIAERSELARSVFEVLADMGKSRPTTDLGRFKARVVEHYGQSVKPDDLLEVFKSFQSAGLGKLVLSKDLAAAPHRFEWTHNNVEVGKAGVSLLNNTPSPVGRGQAPMARGLGASPLQNHAPMATGAVPPGHVVLSYPIRGQLVTFNLPSDLSKAEAKALGDFIARFGR